VELADATAALAEYVRDVRKQPVVVLKAGKPVAAVVPMSESEWEDYVVSHHFPLVESTRRAKERFKAQGGSSLESVRRRLSQPPKAVRSRRPTATRRTRAK
jgi:prevent-host-death family protein